MSVKPKIKYGVLVCATIVIVIIIIANGSIPQDISYHTFADTREIASVPNFWNVVSNLPFLIIGLAGMLFIVLKKEKYKFALNLFIFFAGIFLTGIGSSYYHYMPSNQSLVWDRLPMTISFMSFSSIIIGYYICVDSAKGILLHFLIIGAISVLYWQMTESRGYGDLRFYVLVQFLPIILIPLILILFQNKYQITRVFWLMILMYAFAKIAEATDIIIFKEIHLSGHTLKHLLSAAAPTLYLIYLVKESNIQKTPDSFNSIAK